GAQADGQMLGLQRFIAVDIGHRNFGGGNQPEIVVLALEQIGGEFRKLAGSVKALRVHQKGREHFGVAVATRVDIQKKIDQRALQARAHPPVERETRAGDLGGAVEIQDAQSGTQVPVSLGVKIE